MFPLINSWYVFPSEFYPTEEAILTDAAMASDWYADNYTHVCDLTLTLDGEELADYQTLYEDFWLS